MNGRTFYYNDQLYDICFESLPFSIRKWNTEVNATRRKLTGILSHEGEEGNDSDTTLKIEADVVIIEHLEERISSKQ